jgi:hypothetical protein
LVGHELILGSPLMLQAQQNEDVEVWGSDALLSSSKDRDVFSEA